ncbi:hypothetical protein ACJX0J_013178, partial [Zea mays]
AGDEKYSYIFLAQNHGPLSPYTCPGYYIQVKAFGIIPEVVNGVYNLGIEHNNIRYITGFFASITSFAYAKVHLAIGSYFVVAFFVVGAKIFLIEVHLVDHLVWSFNLKIITIISSHKYKLHECAHGKHITAPLIFHLGGHNIHKTMTPCNRSILYMIGGCVAHTYLLTFIYVFPSSIDDASPFLSLDFRRTHILLSMHFWCGRLTQTLAYRACMGHKSYLMPMSKELALILWARDIGSMG